MASGKRRRIWFLAMLVSIVGCAPPDVSTEYGKRSGGRGGGSVNGTGVLAGMFEESGCRVSTKRLLTSRQNQYDTVVWFPDDFALPSEEVQDFFEEWLYRGHGRTLVYVGRDFDAGPGYWETVLPETPPEQAVEVLRRLARARAGYEGRRGAMPAKGQCRWFRVERDGEAERFGGDPASAPRLTGGWAESLDPSRVEIRLRGRLKPNPDAEPGEFSGAYQTEVLLAADGEVLAWRIRNPYWDDGQVIVVANGSFLLNLPLVEIEHRKLAGQLVGSCKDEAKVAFFESGPGEIMILDQEAGTDFPTGFEWLKIWPINVVSLHVMVLGLVVLFARLLIFGRPWEAAHVPVSDFGKHIDALGRLLAATKNSTYAARRLNEFEDRVRGDGSESRDAHDVETR